MNIFDKNHNTILYHGYFTAANVWVEDSSATLADCFIAALAHGADLTGADLKGMKFTTAPDMTNAKCSQADFEGCDFPLGANLTGADLRGANLKGSTWGVSPTLYTAANAVKLQGANMPMDLTSYANWAGASYSADVIYSGWSYETATPTLP